MNQKDSFDFCCIQGVTDGMLLYEYNGHIVKDTSRV